MSGNRVVSQAFAQMMGHALGEAPRVDKNEHGAMLRGQSGETIVDFVPHFVGSHRAKFAAGNFHGQIELAPMTNLHDHGIGAIRAGKKMSYEVNGLLRGGKSE